jgi:hypothetical protein
MSPVGTWHAPVRQPEGFRVSWRGTDVNAKGRALLTGWDGTNLIGRWSRPDGRWRKSFVVATGESNPAFGEVAVNRRGDAVVAWGAKGRVGQVWARYKLAGRAWTKPTKLTGADNPPRYFAVAIGDCGHTAVAWTTRDNRQIQVQRASPRHDR